MADLFSHKETWRKLYLAALDFKEVAPWEWMSDEQIFGVQHPVTREIGYCCIMGALEELFALAVYLGSEGLNSYLNILSGDYPFDEVFSSQKCLMASFEPRQNLTRQDLKLIKELGFKFRGAYSWPLFRNYQPGYLPWYLTLEEAEFLTLALQQSKEAAIRLGQNHKLLKPPRRGDYLVRIPEGEGDALTWKDAWVRPEPWQPVLIMPQPDKAALQKIKETVSQTGDVWELDYFQAPIPVNDKGRPYFPRVLLAVDQFSGLVLICHLAAEGNYQTEFQDAFIRLIQRMNAVPKKVLVGRLELNNLLAPIKAGLNFKMKMANKLKVLELTKASLFDFCLGPSSDLDND